MTRAHYFAITSAIVLATTSLAQDFKSRLAVARSTNQIITYYTKFKVLGDPRWASFSHGDRPIFVTWYEPRDANRPSTEFQAYFLRDKQWYLFLDDAAAAGKISVLITPQDDKLVFLSDGQKEFFSHSLADLKPIYQNTK
jgi:hypothetical protein